MANKNLTLEEISKIIAEASKAKERTTSELSPKQEQDLLNAMKKLSQEDEFLE